MDGLAFDGGERYTIVRRIGAGGFGVVYEAIDKTTGERVALKTLHEVQPESLYRLKHEFRSLADIEHPNLVSLYELTVVGEDEWFFTMELIDGVDFLAGVSSTRAPGAPTRDVPPQGVDADEAPASRAAAPTGKVDANVLTMPLETAIAERVATVLPRPRPRPCVEPERLRPLLGQLAEGVAALHRSGMLHRDLKPSNVLVSREGRVVILDFGLVEETRHRSLNPQLLGTIEYMSPEQAAGDAATQASDWYSVGVIIFEALSGRLPFEGPLVDMVGKKVMEGPPELSLLVDGIPEDLASLCMRLLARDPAQRPDAAAILAALGVAREEHVLAAPAVLVGRDAELDTLSRAAARSRGGVAVVVSIHGPPGIGKTALVDDFLGGLSDGRSSRGSLVLRGRCYERESVPYKAVDSVIDVLGRELRSRERSGTDLRSLLPSAIGTLARLFPVLRRVMAIDRAERRASDDTLDPDELRQQGFAALRELLWGLAREAPLILFLDDLHWGDRDSAALLSTLLQAPSPPPLLLLASYRDSAREDSPCVELLASGCPARADLERRDLSLERLTVPEAQELARTLLGGEGRGAEADALAREADASPLHIVELCRILRTAGEGEDAGSVRRTSLGEVLGAVYRGLGGLAKELLEAVVLAGKPLDSVVALSVAGIAQGGRAAVAQLRRENLVRVSGKRLEPAHEWVRAAVLAELAGEREVLLHRRLAQAHRGQTPVDVDALAFHYAAGGELDKAAPYALKAASRAADAFAFDRAASLYRTALTGTLSSRDRADVLISLGDALVSAGRGAEAADVFLEAAQLTLSVGGSGEALDLRRRAGFELLRSGRIDAGFGVLQRVLSEVGMRLADRPWRAITSLLRHRLALRVRGLAFVEPPEDALDEELLQRADVAWSIGASGLGMVDDLAAGEFQSLALRLALKSGEPSRVLRALAGEIAFSAVGGSNSLARTQRLQHTARALAERLDRPELRGMLSMTSGIAAYLQGRFAESVESTSRADALLTGPSAAWDRVNARLWGLQAEIYRGHLAAVGERLPGLLGDAERRGDIYLQTSLWACPTRLWWLATDRAEEAAAGLAAAVSRWSTRGFQVQHYWQLCARCELDLYRGQPESAAARLAADWGRLRTFMRIQFVAIEASYLRSKILLACGLTRRTRRLVHRDIRRIERGGARWGLGLAALLRAGVEVQGAGVGVVPRSAEHRLAEAAAAFETADMDLYAAIARHLRGQLIAGAAGLRLRESSGIWLSGQGVRDVERLVRTLAPGIASAP